MQLTWSFVIRIVLPFITLVVALFGSSYDTKENDPKRPGKMRLSRIAWVSRAGLILSLILNMLLVGYESRDTHNQQNALSHRILDAKAEVIKAESTLELINKSLLTSEGLQASISRATIQNISRVKELETLLDKSSGQLSIIQNGQRRERLMQEAQDIVAEHVSRAQEELLADTKQSASQISAELYPFRPTSVTFAVSFSNDDPILRPALESLISIRNRMVAQFAKDSKNRGRSFELAPFTLNVPLGGGSNWQRIERHNQGIDTLTVGPTDEWFKNMDRRSMEKLVLTNLLLSPYVLAIGDRSQIFGKDGSSRPPLRYTFGVDDSHLIIVPEAHATVVVAKCSLIGLSVGQGKTSLGFPQLSGKYAELILAGPSPRAVVDPSRIKVIGETGITLSCAPPIGEDLGGPGKGGTGLICRGTDIVPVRPEYPPLEPTLGDTYRRHEFTRIAFLIRSQSLYY